MLSKREYHTLPMIRRAIPGDEYRLAKLAVQTFRQTYERHSTRENMALYLSTSFSPDKQLSEINDVNMETWILEKGADLVGFMQLRSKKCPISQGADSDYELWRIYVDASYQGKGLGAQLLDQAVKSAERKNSALIWLGVSEYNEKAITFYERNGFEEIGEHIFMLGDDPQRDLVMTRKIAFCYQPQSLT